MCDGYLLRSCASGAFAVRLHGGVSLHFRAVDHRFGTYPCHQRNTVLPFPRPEGRGCHQVLGEDLHRDVRVRLGHGHHDGVLLRNELGGLLEVRRRHLRCAAGRRGAARVLPGVHVPGRAAVRAQARVAEVLHGVGLARSVGPVDPHRELVDADPGRRGAVRRRLEGRHHRLPDRGDEPVGMAALLAHHRGRAHHGRVRGHGRFRVVPHQEPPQGIRHEDDEAGRRGGHRGQLRHAGHGSFLRRHRRRGAAHEACHDGGHVRLRGASSVRVRVG